MRQIKYKKSKRINPKMIEEILHVQKTKGLTAKNLLENARSKKSSLHSYFDWDNKSAGEKWRLHQARMLINEVIITVDNKQMYAFENIKVGLNNNSFCSSREYKPIMEVLSNKSYRKQLIKRALEEVQYWMNKHKQLNEFNMVFESIETVSKKWQKKR